VTTALHKLDLDDSLVRALPMALARKLESRGSFDEIAVNYAMTALQNRRSKAEEDVMAKQEDLKGSEDTFERSTAQYKDAMEDHDASIEGVGQAEGRKKELVGYLKQAEKNLANHDSTIAQVASTSKKLEKELNGFQGVIRTFSELVERDAVEKKTVEESSEPTEESSIPEVEDASGFVGGAQYQNDRGDPFGQFDDSEA